MTDVEKTLVNRVVREVRPYAIAPDHALAMTIKLTLEAIAKGTPGDLVECGVWRGGSSFAMLLAQRYHFGEIRRPVHMFDSFEGMSPPSPEDGEHGAWWYRRSLSLEADPDNQNWCIASDAEVMANAEKLGLAEHVCLHKGWLHETLPQYKQPAIAVLRVDCDWYEPCKVVLNELAERVSAGGAIIMDDYYAWEGCRLATHEYLAANKLPWMIRSITYLQGCYMIKTEATW